MRVYGTCAAKGVLPLQRDCDYVAFQTISLKIKFENDV